MLVIKRYPNRKLYNTSSKSYITLDGIAELIKEGNELQILDNTTGEDLTALTLSQIIFEQEKKSSGFLPKTVLTGLVQSGGDTLNTLRRTLASPLGLLSDVDAEIERRIQRLIATEELEEEQGLALLDKLIDQKHQTDEKAQPSDTYLNRLLNKQNIPSKNDLDLLSRQIDALANKIDSISQERSNTPKQSMANSGTT